MQNPLLNWVRRVGVAGKRQAQELAEREHARVLARTVVTVGRGLLAPGAQPARGLWVAPPGMKIALRIGHGHRAVVDRFDHAAADDLNDRLIPDVALLVLGPQARG